MGTKIALLLMFASSSLELRTTELVFPSQPVGTVSMGKHVLVINTDTQRAAAFDPAARFQVTGDFDLDRVAANRAKQKECDVAKPLQPLEWCVINIAFKPITKGARTGKLSFRSVDGDTFDIPLSGTGQ